MGLNKSRGNMYDWVTHTWSPIIGCQHQCSYCYVKKYREQPVEPVLREDFPPLGKRRTIFVGHLCDMFAANVPDEMIWRVLRHCEIYPENVYVFQSKNPGNIRHANVSRIIGTTIETNRADMLAKISAAPHPHDRALAIGRMESQTFVTIEPILDFDVPDLVALVKLARPTFVNIAADSKGHRLPEPPLSKVNELIAALNEARIPIRKKFNLERLVEK